MKSKTIKLQQMELALARFDALIILLTEQVRGGNGTAPTTLSIMSAAVHESAIGPTEKSSRIQ
jgi:hypothetical protein